MRETGLNALMKIVLRFLLVLVCCVAGWQIALALMQIQPSWFTDLTHPNIVTAFCIIIFAFIGYMITPFVWWLLKKIGTLFENMLQNVSMQDISVAILGLIVGLLLANLFAIPFRAIDVIGFYIAVLLNITCAFVGMRAFLKRREDIWGFLLGILGRGRIFSRSDRKESPKADERSGSQNRITGSEKAVFTPKVVDTSSLIDGRILDIISTGFLEGTLVLPRFVLTELQGVADSSDPVRRARGRKGLSVVSDLQSIGTMDVTIEDTPMKELDRDKVDEALIELCKKLDAKIITTDFNLNQISRIEGIDVLNVNELANSLKPQFLPGDQVKIDIIRPGKEKGQGVGYLEDGTMLVVEDGESKIGRSSDIMITSMLQTAAGRMVFGKLKR